MEEKLINQAYEIAKERYANIGIDTDKVLEAMQNFHLSLHCWQADDVTGFEKLATSLSGGIQVTGNYPGKARNIDELRQDIIKAKSLIPGTHRLNLHEIYGDFKGQAVDRDEGTPEHFRSWRDWGKEQCSFQVRFRTPWTRCSPSCAHIWSRKSCPANLSGVRGRGICSEWCPLGLRPRHHNGRQHDGPLQRNREGRRTRPCTLRT